MARKTIEAVYERPGLCLRVRNLACALIENAYAYAEPDTLRNQNNIGVRNAQRREAFAWFNAKSSPEIFFTFAWCCLVLDLELESFRVKILNRLKEGKKRAGKFGMMGRPTKDAFYTVSGKKRSLWIEKGFDV